jgi:hypothetical protein
MKPALKKCSKTIAIAPFRRILSPIVGNNLLNKLKHSIRKNNKKLKLTGLIFFSILALDNKSLGLGRDPHDLIRFLLKRRRQKEVQQGAWKEILSPEYRKFKEKVLTI